MHASQFAGAGSKAQHGWARVTMQDHYNLIYREEEREMLWHVPSGSSPRP
jgi:aryl-alcohol dehydrogenase-like predicted oxidoreductase